jgi:putative lysine transport system substrate-binding protein
MKKMLLVMCLVFMIVMLLGGCGAKQENTLRVGMECAYAPYNWTQPTNANGAVQINGSSDYAYGYDVMMAKYLADKLGYTLEIHKMDWDSLPIAVQSGIVDCVIAGQSITEERITYILCRVLELD